MRNLKKILALVLALVMSLSLVTMANADYADQADIDNAEAVAVLSALEVLEGADGKFNPDGILTREQAAKIITYMVLGAEKADKLTTVIAPFSDVEATRWSAGAIAYCADQGILAGIGGGNFAPTAKLTGLQFAKMLLCALGYDSSIEGLTGDAWAIKVATLAIELGLDDGIAADLSAEMSRENAAQMALNALECTMVKYEGGTTVELPGGTKVVVGATKYDVTNKDTNYDKTAKESDGKMQFVEKYFADLTKEGAADETFKRPNSYSWKLKGESDPVYTASKAADLTYTGKVDLVDVWKDMGKPSTTELTKVTLYVNGGSADDITDEVVKDSKNTLGDINWASEVYFDKDAKEATIIAIKYNVGTVSKVNADKVDKYGDVTKKAHVIIEGKEFETTAYAKDDVVLYALVGSAIKDVKLADSFTGKVTNVKGTDVTIDGSVYTNAAGLVLGSEGTFYKGVCGAIVKAEATKTTSDDYAYIYNIVADDGKGDKNEDGFSTDSPFKTAYVVLADGTKASYVIETETAKTWAKGDVVCYEINSDGEIEAATAEDTLKTDKASVKFGKNSAIVNTKYTNADTNFVFAYEKTEEGKATVVNTKVVTGYKNVAEQTANTVVIYDKESGKALTVFVMAEAAAEVVDAKDIYVLMSADASKGYAEDGKTEIYSYDVQVNGKADVIKSEKEVLKGQSAGYLFTVELTDGLVADSTDITSATVVSGKTVTAVVDDYIVIGSDSLYFAEDAEIYLVDTEDGYALSETTIAKDDVISYVQVGGTGDDKNDICYVLVTARAE